MKKRAFLIFMVAMLLFPLEVAYKDGGSIGWRSIAGIYSVKEWHEELAESTIEGMSVDILGIRVYDGTYVVEK